MSYLVLARRWRPRRFSDLVGQDVVVQTLKNALNSGNLAHAYLLCGIRGVGKTTIARLMAMAVNCQQPDHGEPCGSCAACSSILDGSSLDVQEMDAASHTGVDDIREILDAVRYPPVSLARKIYIIDEAHMLTKNAFNALLKTLEEPPAHVMFILATTESDKLPVTVRSRCQRFDLRRLGQGEIADYLQHVFQTENKAAESEALTAIARAADGSVRDALSLAERVLAFAAEQLTADDVTAALGLVGDAQVQLLSEALFAADAAAAVRLLRAAMARGHAARTVLEALSRLWHELACLQVDAALCDEFVDAEKRQWMQQQVQRLDAQALDLRYQVLIHGLRDLSLVDAAMGAEMVLIRLCGLQAIAAVAPSQDSSYSQRLAQLTSSEASASQAEALPPRRAVAHADERPAAPQTVEVAASADAPADASDLAAASATELAPELLLQNEAEPAAPEATDWGAVVEAYSAVKPGVAAMLDHVVCVEFGSRLRLALDQHQQRAISAEERRLFAEWLGREVLWESRQADVGESLSQIRARQAQQNAAHLRQQAEADPHVQALMGEMNAKLVKVLPPGVAPEEDR